MALKRLRTVLRELPRITIVVDEARYIHAEARSRLFRFIDDLEFLVDDVQHVIHFRSASRVGLSDFGVNRKRAAAIRASFEQFGQPEG